MYSKEDIDIVYLEKEALVKSNRIKYALAAYGEVSSKNTQSVDDFLSLESIDHRIVENDNVSYYTSFESSVPSDGKDRLKRWIEHAISALMKTSKIIYDLLIKLISNIAKLFRRKKNNKDNDKTLSAIAKKNNIPPSKLKSIDSIFSTIKISDIKPVRVSGSRKVFSMNEIRRKSEEVYSDALLAYYVDPDVRKVAIDLQSGLIKWLRTSSDSTSKFIGGVERIAHSNIKAGSLLTTVTPLEKFIPDENTLVVNSILNFYRKRSDRKTVDRGLGGYYKAIKWTNDDIRNKNHSFTKSKKSGQTLRDIEVYKPIFDNDLFADNLESVGKNLERLSDNKMQIFKMTGDLDIPGVTKLLEIDEKIRKYIFSVYQAVTTVNIISHLEDRHYGLKEAIYNQKLLMLSSFKGVITE